MLEYKLIEILAGSLIAHRILEAVQMKLPPLQTPKPLPVIIFLSQRLAGFC